MIRIEIKTNINRPIEVVFNTLSDLQGYNTWMDKSGLFRSSTQTSAGSPRKGTTFTDSVRGGLAVGEISEFQPPRWIRFRQTVYYHGIKLMESRPGYRLINSNGGTDLHHSAEGNLFGIFRVLEPIMIPIARAERNRTIKALKKYLETRPTPGSA